MQKGSESCVLARKRQIHMRMNDINRRFCRRVFVMILLFAVLAQSPAALAAETEQFPETESAIPLTDKITEPPAASATAPSEASDEPETTVESGKAVPAEPPTDSSTEAHIPAEGVLNVKIDVPSGFAGSVCVELLEEQTGQTTVLCLDSPGYFRLPAGTYEAVGASVPDCDHFGAAYSGAFTVSADLDASLTLTVSCDGSMGAYLERERAGYIPKPVVTLAEERKIWDYLTEITGSSIGAAGIMGNLCAESCLSPINLQDVCEGALGLDDSAYTDAVDSGAYTQFVTDSAGYGLAQWTYASRKGRLYNLSLQRGVSIGSLDLQLDFLAMELEESGLLPMFRNADSIREASDLFLTKVEGPSNQDETIKQTRSQLCEELYWKFALTGADETMTQGQADVCRVAAEPEKYGISGTGQRWAAQVYCAMGFPLDASCCPFCAAMAYGVSSEWNKIPPGATVYGYGGSSFGHVGVYIGDGLVCHNDGHNDGTAKVDTLARWVRVYQGFCWGWAAGTDLTQAY